MRVKKKKLVGIKIKLNNDEVIIFFMVIRLTNILNWIRNNAMRKLKSIIV